LIARHITIATFATRTDAEVAQGLLAAAGIAASVSSDDAGGAYPFDFSGGAQLLVDEDDVEAASELLAGRTGGSRTG
jgi:putative signal transducing protein